MGLQPTPDQVAIVLYFVRKGTTLSVAKSQKLPERRFPLQYVRERDSDGIPLSFFYRILDRDDTELFIGTANDTTGLSVEYVKLERSDTGRERPALGRAKSKRQTSHFSLTIPFFDEAETLEIFRSDPDDETQQRTQRIARIPRSEWAE